MAVAKPYSMDISTEIVPWGINKWQWTIFLSGFPIYHGDGHDTEYAARRHLRDALTALAANARNESVKL